MFKKIFFLVFVLINSFSVYAFTDSIKVENLNGFKSITHKVDPKESYSAIARKYNVNLQKLIQFNNNRPLKIGTIIKVPTEIPFNETKENKFQNDTTSTVSTKEYKVGAREYLLVIARKFNTTVEYLKILNNLKSNNLSIGQILKVPNENAAKEGSEFTPSASIDTPLVNQNPINQIDSVKNASDRLKLAPSRYGLREINERGVASWIADDIIDGTKMMALHKTAPIGTIMKITNTMTGKSTFAKIVGKYAENESNRDVVIVVTKAVADLIGAMDKRFQATLVYGIPNE